MWYNSNNTKSLLFAVVVIVLVLAPSYFFAACIFEIKIKVFSLSLMQYLASYVPGLYCFFFFAAA